jgi:hypothetical protein
VGVVYRDGWLRLQCLLQAGTTANAQQRWRLESWYDHLPPVYLVLDQSRSKHEGAAQLFILVTADPFESL